MQIDLGLLSLIGSVTWCSIMDKVVRKPIPQYSTASTNPIHHFSRPSYIPLTPTFI